MRIREWTSWGLLAVTVLLVMGVVRAGTNRYWEKRSALLEQLAAERKRLGLTDRVALFAKYPTPEIRLCRPLRVAPGAEADVVVGGKFAPGTKVLFDNDLIEVLNETVAPAEYRARIRVPAGIGPTFANAQMFAPVSGGNATCLAVYVGGKYEWEFTASNGWRLKVACPDDSYRPDLSTPPVLECRAEFFRGAELKPFEVRNLHLNLTSVPHDDRYSGWMDENAPPETDYGAEMRRISERLQNPKLSDAESERLTKQLETVMQAMMKQQQAAIAKMQAPGYAQEVERKRAEFGCQRLEFQVRPQSIEGRLSCGQKVGTPSLKGTMKFAGL
jgi:hypothetical protein